MKASLTVLLALLALCQSGCFVYVRQTQASAYGHVTNAKGRPLAGIVVEERLAGISKNERGLLPDTSRTTLTDADGRFDFDSSHELAIYFPFFARRPFGLHYRFHGQGYAETAEEIPLEVDHRFVVRLDQKTSTVELYEEDSGGTIAMKLLSGSLIALTAPVTLSVLFVTLPIWGPFVFW